jgi:hypothetical protein
MQVQDANATRPTADQISRYAERLLATTPGMLPLEAVRRAMEGARGAADPQREPSARAAVQSPGRREKT